MSEFSFRAYCDICNQPSMWYKTPGLAKGWRDLHFESVHPDNPMRKENCRIQRGTNDE